MTQNVKYITQPNNTQLELVQDKVDIFTTGQQKNDTDLVAEFKDFAHSTFDRSKFTVVGSPTITDDGIASGFVNGTSYLRTPIKTTDLLNHSWSIKIQFIPSYAISPLALWKLSNSNSNAGADGWSSCVFNTNTNNLVFWYKTGDNSESSSQLYKEINISSYLSQKVTVVYAFNYSTGIYTFSAYDEAGNKIGGQTYSATTTNKQLYYINTESSFIVTLGTTYSGTASVDGSIDLKQFSIRVDGVEVFNCNKSGIDQIKADNYTVVGSPTISDDGIASGFSTNDYISCSKPDNYTTSLKISSPIFTPSSIADGLNVGLVVGDYNSGFNIQVARSTSNIVCIFRGDNTEIGRATSPISLGNSYQIIFEFDGTTYYIYIKINNGTKTLLRSFSNSTIYAINNNCLIGRSRTSGDIYAWQGSIDLNGFKIYVDGNLVYQPCLKIPYTLTNTDSKVVDSYYKDRVVDMNEQYGYAPYYVLQDSRKGNYTVVGSPTISSDYVASGFSSSNYLTIPYIDYSKSWEIKCKYKTPTSISAQALLQLYTGTTSADDIYVVMTSAGALSFRGIETTLNTTNTLQANTDYNISVGWDETKYYISINNEVEYVTSTTQIISTDTIKIGVERTLWYWQGSMDLKQFKIYVDNALAYEAVTEPNFKVPLGEAYGINATKNLQNLSDEGKEVLVDSKFYKNPEGIIYNDEDLLNDIKEYNRSTFDLSKFTVVGSPTITDDGVASGFSSGNYVTIPYNLDVTSTNYEIDLQFNTSNIINTQTLIGMGGNNQNFSIIIANSKLMLFLGTGSAWSIASGVTGISTLYSNTNYLVKFSRTSNSYIVKLLNQDTNTETTEITVSSTTNLGSLSYLYIGERAYWAYPVGISYDLKQFSITVDGKEVFNGNKSGVDQIKANDYTVVGSPTITDDGIASGFSSNNYINATTIDLSKPTNISCKFTTGNDINTYQMIYGYDLVHCVKIESNKLKCYYNISEINFNIEANTKYKILENWSGTAYTCYLTNMTTGVTQSNSVTVAVSSTTSYNTYIGADWNGSGSFTGSIDLNSFKVYVDGNLVYQPTLRIPYNQSKTGCKIVDSYYRDRVQDMYEQFGWANYYTLSDTNFTVPQGENLDGHVAVVDWYKNGMTSWEYDTNLDCVETGSCTSGTAVTLPKAFSDTNYSLSVPYSAKTATGFTPSATGEYIAKGKIVLG